MSLRRQTPLLEVEGEAGGEGGEDMAVAVEEATASRTMGDMTIGKDINAAVELGSEALHNHTELDHKPMLEIQLQRGPEEKDRMAKLERAKLARQLQKELMRARRRSALFVRVRWYTRPFIHVITERAIFAR